jgi:hypothetical protein
LLAFISMLSLASVWQRVVRHERLLERHPQLEARKINTPTGVQNYIIRNIDYRPCLEIYGKGNFWASPALTLQSRAADSAGAAILAAALLGDDGYPPYILRMYGPVTSTFSPEPRWTLFLYQVDGRYGSIGSRRSDYRGAVFEGIDELVKDAGYAGYDLYDVSRLHDGQLKLNWKKSEGNLGYNVLRVTHPTFIEANFVSNKQERAVVDTGLPEK